MSERRFLILATVTGIKDTHCTYPCCDRCYSKLLNDYEIHRWRCVKCYHGYLEEEMSFRFRLSVFITDGISSCNICLFGSTLDQFFGDKAKVFSRNVEIHEKRHGNSENLLKLALHEVFVGQNFYFGFRIPSSALPNITATLEDVIQYYEANRIKFSQQPTQFEDGMYNTNIISYQIIPSTDSKITTVTEVICNLIKGQANHAKSPTCNVLLTVSSSLRCPELSYEVSLTDSHSFGQPTICLSCDSTSTVYSTSTTCSDCSSSSCQLGPSQKCKNVNDLYNLQMVHDLNKDDGHSVHYSESDDKHESCVERTYCNPTGSHIQTKIVTSNFSKYQHVQKVNQHRGKIKDNIMVESDMNNSGEVTFPDTENIHCIKWQEIPDSEDIEAYLNDTGFESEIKSSQESVQNIPEETKIQVKDFQQCRHDFIRQMPKIKKIETQKNHTNIPDSKKTSYTKWHSTHDSVTDCKVQSSEYFHKTSKISEKIDFCSDMRNQRDDTSISTRNSSFIQNEITQTENESFVLSVLEKAKEKLKPVSSELSNSEMICHSSEEPNHASSTEPSFPQAADCTKDASFEESYSCLNEIFDLDQSESESIEVCDEKENNGPATNQSVVSVKSEISVFENSKIKEVRGIKESVILDGSADLFDMTNALSQAVTPNVSSCLSTNRPENRENSVKYKSVKRTKSVQFAKRLSHVKTTHLIDLQMKMNAMKAKSTIYPFTIRSCLNNVKHVQESEELFSQKNSTHNDSVHFNSLYSQEIFTPSPIFSNKSAHGHDVSHNSLLNDDEISDIRMSTPVVTCNFDSQSALFSDVSNQSKSFSVSQSQNYATENFSPQPSEISPLVFSQFDNSESQIASAKIADVEISAFSASQDLFSPEYSQNLMSFSNTNLPVKKLFYD